MKRDFEKRHLTKKSDNFSQWYIDVILRTGLADYAPVKGCQVFRPYGFAIWENMQKILDSMIKKAGVKNAYFPLFIPQSFLEKEKEHVKGFSPELAIVTHGGGKKLKDPLAVRPTSETIMYNMFAKWINSWRDLPLMVNQWCNVVRWEKRTYLFMRTTEFLWQEGHTVHQNHKKALKEVMRALKMYSVFYRDFLAIDGISGRKSESEKFPGAKETYSYEMLMPDGKALQSCTSHDLGQNFAKVFNIKFLGKNGKENMAWQTSWGLSTRSIGGLIMSHGDDSGLILPPKVSPVQVAIIPVFQGKAKIDKSLEKKAKDIEKDLNNFRVETDLRKEHSVGWKFNDWELRGVPLRIEIGPKELKEKKLTLVRRDTGEKFQSSQSSVSSIIERSLDLIQKKLLQNNRKHLKENTRKASNFKEFKDIMNKNRGFIKAFWCESPKCEQKIKEETKATTRVLPLGVLEEKGKCVYCGKKAKNRWIFAQAY